MSLHPDHSYINSRLLVWYYLNYTSKVEFESYFSSLSKNVKIRWNHVNSNEG